MSHRIGTATAAVGVIATLGTAVVGLSSPANAEDRRPCVSTTEYAEAIDVYTINNAVVGAEVTGPNRRQLERRWEVRRLGVVDRDLTDRQYTVVDYPVCGYSADEASVTVFYYHRGGKAMIRELFIEPNAMPNGHIY